ncbi:L-threonylcarbamoyladenylate synthase [Inhella gelatinilytica]|uniref:Threonylcarbamoyl-AMP synthase n=1 Tax=Inhella gelatinilytica TaxID=2795030 RepID=A0A931NCP0_9BURK|nr:L-threonylcarbamoyladenylate synthase [Inhella gelatinilytica]MBH9552227.1 threonylcarbamoyl-AMP synthase [Inhella gelatinilytica]
MTLTPHEAAVRLAAGGIVALPTETVYGLAARADDDAAVAQIFAAKGRPSDHPLIVHVADAAAAQHFAGEWPALAQQLTAAFWPGPLTVIVPRRAGVAQAAAGGQATVGLRCPAHPHFHAVLEAAVALGVPGLAAPSANRFGRVSPTTAAHVLQEFDGTVPVVDGGACGVGIESTIVDCSRGRPVLLRPGMVDAAQIEAVLGEPLVAPDAQAPKASGTLEAHYAPRARVRLWAGADLQRALSGPHPAGLTVYSRTPWAAGPWAAFPADPDTAAQHLFATLRALDDAGAQEIWVEAPPADDPRWAGVLDRLRRAAAAG